MKYLLAMLSHGHPTSPTASNTLLSFLQHADQAPAYAVFHHDGPGHPHYTETCDHEHSNGDTQLGFCGATRTLWTKAVRAAIDRNLSYIFWLEHDFLFTRQLPIREMALRLRDPRLAQVALIREPVNKQEEEAGGVYQMHPPTDYIQESEGEHAWLEHRINFTTNPSLMRTRTMQDNPWPTYESECEGNFGLDLLAKGYHFAYWGSGEPWVRHVGTLRTGHSY